jgi:hypothetical protein
MKGSVCVNMSEAIMLNRELVAKAVKELETPLRRSERAERVTTAYFVAASLCLEGIPSTPESVLAAVDGRHPTREVLAPRVG